MISPSNWINFLSWNVSLGRIRRWTGRPCRLGECRQGLRREPEGMASFLFWNVHRFWRTGGLCLNQYSLRACHHSWCHHRSQSLPIHILTWRSSHRKWPSISAFQALTPPKNRDILPTTDSDICARLSPVAFDMFSHLCLHHHMAHQLWWYSPPALSLFSVAIAVCLQKDHHHRPAAAVAGTKQRRDYLQSTGPFAAVLVLCNLPHLCPLLQLRMD